MTDFEELERLFSETFDDRLFYDFANEDGSVSDGSCTIAGTLYKWRIHLDEAWRVRISYRVASGECHNDCYVEDVDPKLIEYLRRMATAVGIIRRAQDGPRSAYEDHNDGWVKR
jgi:hypothetical protein